jgi:hypothetical protein
VRRAEAPPQAAPSHEPLPPPLEDEPLEAEAPPQLAPPPPLAVLPADELRRLLPNDPLPPAPNGRASRSTRASTAPQAMVWLPRQDRAATSPPGRHDRSSEARSALQARRAAI